MHSSPLPHVQKYAQTSALHRIVELALRHTPAAQV